MPEDRLATPIHVLLAVAGGALAVSLALFLGSDSLELDAGLVGALQLAWLALFYALGAGVALRFVALLGEPRLLKRLLAGTAFAAFLVGLALLAYVSVVALASANADYPDDAQQTRSST
jgi:hypothetical protein